MLLKQFLLLVSLQQSWRLPPVVLTQTAPRFRPCSIRRLDLCANTKHEIKTQTVKRNAKKRNSSVLALTISDMRALKCWVASSRLCCSLSLSISLVCSDRALCTSLSLSLRLASIRACLSSSFSFSASTLYTTHRFESREKYQSYRSIW